MKNSLMNKNSVSELAKASNMITRNFSEFAQSYKGNTSGIKVAVSIKDNQGIWHTMTQRLFKNGSIHIAKH